MLRYAPHLAIFMLAGPILCGILATLLPAIGIFPALGGHQFTTEHFSSLFAQPGLWRSAWISLSAGLITTLISLCLVMAFFAAWSNTRFFARVQHLVSPLLSIPHAAAAFGFAFMIAPSGWLMRLISPELTGLTRPPDVQILNDPWGFAMMAGLVIKEVPFLFLVLLAALPQVKPDAHQKIATGLGYGRMAGFLLVLGPPLYRQIRLAVFAVIAYASSVVDVALILGPTNPAPLAVRLVDWMNDPDLTRRFMASAGAVLQFLLTAAALLIWLMLERIGSAIAARFSASGRRWRRDRTARIAAGTAMSLAAGLVFAGLGALALWSFAGYWAFPDALPASWSMKTWSRHLQAVGVPLSITVNIAFIATLAAVCLTLACLERETRLGRSGGTRALGIVYLPLLVPQPAFLFGLQMLFLAVGLNGWFWAVVMVHIVFVLPYVFLSLSDPWRALDGRYGQIATSLGATANRIFWRIRMPMMLRAILAAAAIGFAVSIGQYLPTLLVGAGRWPTLTTEAVGLAAGGDRRVIGVYAFLQMALPFAGFLVATLVPALLFARRKGMKTG
ncbi:ABC transporter permease [Salaquimonas pukyongi]|uniref:ABC transporter permease n=1 Tax=Salaquimonas pukyongi TaxID=2712698 RepID=UPI00096B7261|nr:ABC transporter permease subunit [Salaquimonas pukyongi]